MSVKLRNVSGVDLSVPELGRIVKADAVVDVPDARAPGYTCQGDTWKPIANLAPKKSKDEE